MQQGYLMFLFCRPRHLATIVEEIGDWCEAEGGTILLYGQSDKAREGFILTQWPRLVPETVTRDFLGDKDVYDYVVYEIKPPLLDMQPGTNNQTP